MLRSVGAQHEVIRRQTTSCWFELGIAWLDPRHEETAISLPGDNCRRVDGTTAAIDRPIVGLTIGQAFTDVAAGGLAMTDQT
jgi:hypothetical protein